MNLITRGTNNILIFTLNERKTLTNPYYLCKMTSRATRTVKRFILPANQSDYKDRFDQFTITETSGTEILTSGVVTLTPTGEWTYEIYEQLSSTNVNESASDNKVALETGLMKVTGTDNTYNFYDNQTKEYKTYGTGSS